MKTPYLLGIITALLFGSFAISGMMAQGGVEDLEILIVVDSLQTTIVGPTTSTATCPPTHKVIGGGIDTWINRNAPLNPSFAQREIINLIANSFEVIIDDNDQGNAIQFAVFASCAKINFPMNGMSMIGGELLDLDTMALFIGAIGVNPVITGLVAITMSGVAAQAIWYVNSRRVKSENS